MVDRLRSIVDQQLFRSGVRVPDVSSVQSVFVRSTDELQAAVLEGCVFERQPKSDSRFGLGAKVGSVLVRSHLTTDARILENVHALSHCWALEAQLPAKFTDSVVESVLPEHWMLGGQSMSDLVQRELFGHQQLVVASNGTGFEKVANFITRLDEILFAILELQKLVINSNQPKVTCLLATTQRRWLRRFSGLPLAPVNTSPSRL